MPKGVMWRQDDLFAKLNAGNLLRVPEDGGLDGVRKTIVGTGPLHLPACPLMHGTGGFTAMAAMTVGGCIVTLTDRHFDPVELLDTIDRDNVNTVAIVGDAFAKPHPAHPRRAPGPVAPVDVARLRVVGRDVERGDQAGPACTITPT